MSRRQRHLNPRHCGATLALDARRISGVADGASVSSWPGTTAVQNDATAVIAPTYQARWNGGSPAVRFARASSQQMSLTRTTSALFSGVADTTILSAFVHTAGANTLIGDSTGANRYVLHPGYSGITYLDIGVTPAGRLSGTLSFLSPSVMTAFRNGGSMEVRSNGATALSKTGASGSPTGSNSVRIGANAGFDPLDGRIGALIVLPYAATPSQIRRLEQALALSFKIAIS